MSSTLANMIATLVKDFVPTIDVDDPLFQEQVVAPILRYVGDEQVWPNTRQLIEDRLRESAPDLDQTVFGDLFAKPLENILDPILYQVRTLQGKRDIVNSPYLVERDLNAFANNFLTTRAQGSTARGTVRVYFSSPRTFQAGFNTLLSLDKDGNHLIYYAAESVSVTAQEMSSSREGNLYYVDVDIVAGEAGARFNLQRGEAAAMAGFTGSVRVMNYSPVVGGSDSANIISTTQSINNALTYRGLATRASLNYLLPTLQIRKSYGSTAGDPFMIRDRIFFEDPDTGAGSIVWIPGGLIQEEIPVGVSNYLSLGIAYDIWVKTQTYDTRKSFKIANLRNEGMEILSANDGMLTRLPDTGYFYELKVAGRRFHPTEIVSLPEDRQPSVRNCRPVQVGDIVEMEGSLKTDAGIPSTHKRYRIVEVVNDTTLRLELLPQDVDEFTEGLVGDRLGGTAYRVLSQGTNIYRLSDYTIPHYQVGEATQSDQAPRPEFFVDPFAIPLTGVRAYLSDGTEATRNGKPQLPAPHTHAPELGLGDGTTIVKNLVSEASGLPCRIVERISYVDVDGQLSYSYPRHPLFAEIIEVKERIDNFGRTPSSYVLRTHFLGPMDFAWLPTLTGEWMSGTVRDPQGNLWLPTYWGQWRETLPEGDEILQVSGVYDGGSGAFPGLQASHQLIRPDTHVAVLRTDDGELHVAEIVSVNFTDSYTIQLEAPGFPGGVSGLISFVPGITRRKMLNQGRTPEGTYYFDSEVRAADVVSRHWEAGIPVVEPKVVLGQHMTPVDPRVFYTSGFELVSPIPGLQYSDDEQVSLLFDSTNLGGTPLDSREVTVFAVPGNEIKDLQRTISSGSDDVYTPIVATGLVRQFCPTYVVLSFVYESPSVGAQQAAQLVYESVQSQTSEQRLELSDIEAELYSRGITYVLPGRAFALRLNHNRQYEMFATKAAIASLPVGEFIVTAITVSRIPVREPGKVIDETNPANFIETFTMRPGGYDAD